MQQLRRLALSVLLLGSGLLWRSGGAFRPRRLQVRATAAHHAADAAVAEGGRPAERSTSFSEQKEPQHGRGQRPPGTPSANASAPLPHSLRHNESRGASLHREEASLLRQRRPPPARAPEDMEEHGGFPRRLWKMGARSRMSGLLNVSVSSAKRLYSGMVHRFDDHKAKFMEGALGTRVVLRKWAALHNGTCLYNELGERVGCVADCSCGWGSRCYPRFVLLDDAGDQFSGRRWFNIGVCDVDMRLPLVLSLILFAGVFFGFIACYRWQFPLRPKEYTTIPDIQVNDSASACGSADGIDRFTVGQPAQRLLRGLAPAWQAPAAGALSGATVRASASAAANARDAVQRTMLEPRAFP